MFASTWGVVRQGKVELIENLALAEGTRVLVTAMPVDEDNQFWRDASQSALAKIWDIPQDDVYAELLEK